MFQTEPVLMLQALGGPSMTAALDFVSSLGNERFYLLVVVALAFGSDMRQGWLVGQAVLWTAGLTIYGKEFFALPRPSDVDWRVIDPVAGGASQAMFEGRGAAGVLSALPGDVVGFYRTRADIAWGFPSGHTSVFSAMTGSLALARGVRRWWWAWFAGGATMALSRVYLGRHFIADVLAGLIVGAIVLGTLDTICRQAISPASNWLVAPVDAATTALGGAFGAWYWWAPALFLPLSLTGEAHYAAYLWGLNFGVWFCMQRGWVAAPRVPLRRLGRLAVALPTAFLVQIGGNRLFDALTLGRWPVVEAACTAVLLAGMIIAAAWLSRRLGLG